MTSATASAPAPPRAAPRRAAVPTQAPQRPAPKPAVAFGKVRANTGHRIVLYGPGGIGKTSLACLAPGPVAFFDLDDSLGVLMGQLPEGADIRPVTDASDWQTVRDALHAGGWDEIRTVVIDSATKAEELCLRWVLDNIKTDKGAKAERMEDYPYGKGYTHLYDTFLLLLGDLDQHVRAGRNVVLICHDCTAAVPNPRGEDWIRYEPRLQSPSSGKASVRLRVREWADHVLFLGYDVAVKDGKASDRSCQTRTIYTTERPHCMAKSRTLDEEIVTAKGDATLWTNLLGN